MKFLIVKDININILKCLRCQRKLLLKTKYQLKSVRNQNLHQLKVHVITDEIINNLSYFLEYCLNIQFSFCYEIRKLFLLCKLWYVCRGGNRKRMKFSHAQSSRRRPMHRGNFMEKMKEKLMLRSDIINVFDVPEFYVSLMFLKFQTYL